jgi:hypothetical protein
MYERVQLASEGVPSPSRSLNRASSASYAWERTLNETAAAVGACATAACSHA